MESTEKVKRLPRSAKKRLRYEKLRQLRKESDKKKKKQKKNTNTSNESDSNGKVERRLATERLEQVNRDGLAPVICIDCSYNDSMSTKELASLARQIGRCYSSNRRAEKPVQFILANWSNESSLAAECRRVNAGFDRYPVEFTMKTILLKDQSIDQLYPKERLIYLSPNAEQSLTEINEDHVHIIGGLVDESVRKNMTFATCEEKNINCFKLPIQTYMKHSTEGGSFNQILSINQVFDILLSYLSTKNWQIALKKNVPERKGWVIKDEETKE